MSRQGDSGLSDRLAIALGLPSAATVVKSRGSFGAIVAELRGEEVRKAMARDPFAAARGTLADQLQRLVVDQRPDLAESAWDVAVKKIEGAYPGLLQRLVADAGIAPDGSGAAVLEKRAKALAAADDGLTIERARALILDEDAGLRTVVLAEEGGGEV